MMGLKGTSVYVTESIQPSLGGCGPGEAGRREGLGRRSLGRTMGFGAFDSPRPKEWERRESTLSFNISGEQGLRHQERKPSQS